MTSKKIVDWLLSDDFDADELGRVVINDVEMLALVNGAFSEYSAEQAMVNGDCSNAGCGSNADCSNAGC